MNTFLKVYVRRNRIMISGKGGDGPRRKMAQKIPAGRDRPSGEERERRSAVPAAVIAVVMMVDFTEVDRRGPGIANFIVLPLFSGCGESRTS